MTTATAALSFENLVKDYSDRGDLDAIVNAIWEDHGPEIFRLFGDEWALSLLRYRLRQYFHNERRSSFRTIWAMEGNPVGVPRMAIGGDYWASRWLVDGEYKELRGLTVAEAKMLAGEYAERAAQNRAFQTFFEESAALALKHKVKTLGGLEKKGIDLPGAETVENGDGE